MKLKHDYYRPGSHHMCMFCHTPIARLIEGRLQALGNKAHVILERQEGGLYVINCCADCAKNVDFKDAKVIEKVHEAVCKCRELLNPADDHAKHRANKPKIGFIRRELDTAERGKHLRDYKEHLDARKL